MSTIKAGKIQPPGDSDPLQIFTNTVERITVTSGGLVGIGITPLSKLHVVGGQNYGGATNSGILTVGNANNSRQINFGVSDTNSVVWIEGWIPGSGGSHLVLQPTLGGGNVGIGIIPLVALHVAGEARSSTSTTSTSAATTLTTKDYVDNQNRIGNTICIGWMGNNGASKFGFTCSTDSTPVVTFPTGTLWSGWWIHYYSSGVGNSQPAIFENVSSVTSSIHASTNTATYGHTFVATRIS